MTRLRVFLATAPLAASLACGHADITNSVDRHPTFDTGVAATIIMPNQQSPAMQQPPPGWAAPGAPTSPYGVAPGYPPPAPGSIPGVPPVPVPLPPGAMPPQALGAAGAPAYPYPGYGGYGYPASDPETRFSSIGGAKIDRVGETRVKSKPSFFRYLKVPLAIAALPFKILAWPFVKLGQLATRDDGPPPATAWTPPQGASPAPGVPPRASAVAPGGVAPPGAWPPTRQQVHAAQEQARLAELEQQLATAQAPGAAPAGEPAPQRVASAAATPRSIADELDSLRRRQEASGKLLPEPPPPPTARPAPPVQGLADRVEDRNGDGRPDYWAFKDGERLAREVSDEDADGRTDRVTHYDEAGRISRVSLDTNRDGRPDSWEEYVAGEMVRRRTDTTGDGEPDAWEFHRAGQIQRQERDTDGDGFRDRLAVYANGVLSREEEDRNADGRPDRITWYDAAGQPAKRDEDSDGDGAVDVRSHYEGGKLARRELLTEEALSGAADDVASAPAEEIPGEEVPSDREFRE
jgi:hypothetical protein